MAEIRASDIVGVTLVGAGWIPAVDGMTVIQARDHGIFIVDGGELTVYPSARVDRVTLNPAQSWRSVSVC